jgi:hypothetical protein
MDSLQRRMVVVALVVCAFAVGMAGLLNFFKYRATATRLVEQRLGFAARSIENSIQSSLALGLQFADLQALPGRLEREQASVELIRGIDVIDAEGQTRYSTEPSRRAQAAPSAWLAAARKGGRQGWALHDGADPAVGRVLLNPFGLAIGQVVVRYPGERRDQAAQQMARELAWNALAVLALAAPLAALALLLVLRGLRRDLDAVRPALDAGDVAAARSACRRGPLRSALGRFGRTVQGVESELQSLRTGLQQGPGA